MTAEAETAAASVSLSMSDRSFKMQRRKSLTTLAAKLYRFIACSRDRECVGCHFIGGELLPHTQTTVWPSGTSKSSKSTSAHLRSKRAHYTCVTFIKLCTTNPWKCCCGRVSFVFHSAMPKHWTCHHQVALEQL